ncbi:BPSS1780 family membrane protein [Chromobacterium subtsugae]|uniref:BPSS1780 family membrane protein n=1 Tax=Chromobacterium subtsugae TaxID=251747 RepID=UPI00209E5FAD|nr:BPSS1780 family membrane protein [Chromobacterium subtsugae]
MQSFDIPPLPRKVGAGRGWRWCVEAFHIVREQPLTWVLLTLVYLLIHFAINAVPMIGGLVGAIIGPVFAGGFVMAARKSERGEELELADLFAGFRLMPGPLLQVGALFFALMLAAMLALVAVGAASGVTSGLLGGHLQLQAHSDALFGVVLALVGLMTVVMFIVSLCYWFAPALVALGGVAPWQAIRSSFLGRPEQLGGIAGGRPGLVLAGPAGFGAAGPGPAAVVPGGLRHRLYQLEGHFRPRGRGAIARRFAPSETPSARRGADGVFYRGSRAVRLRTAPAVRCAPPAACSPAPAASRR